VPCQAIQFLSEVVEDPQVEARGPIIQVEHPTAGTVRTVGSPWRLGSNGKHPDHRPAPLLGADTRGVLVEAGYTEEEINALVEKGVTWTANAKMRS
jgi:crotonobetainyl-CoA:carnitine CoA-transferase CaiB-like acyl-CoA transferase